jgi:hypothetical protein
VRVHLRNLNAVTIFVLAPVAGLAVRADWLQFVGFWMPGQFFAVMAVAASRMRLHLRLSLLLVISGGCLSVRGQYEFQPHLPLVHLRRNWLDRSVMGSLQIGQDLPFASSITPSP